MSQPLSCVVGMAHKVLAAHLEAALTFWGPQQFPQKQERAPTPRDKPINATCERREQAAREPEGTGGPWRERRVRGSWAVEQNRRGRRPRGRGKGGPCRGTTVLGREKGGLWRSERDTKRVDRAWISKEACAPVPRASQDRGHGYPGPWHSHPQRPSLPPT